MNLKQYLKEQEEDKNLFWKLSPGDHQNLLDEAIELIDNPEIDQLKNIIIDLLKFAETEEQRKQSLILIDLFKNKFKRTPTLMKYVWEIQSSRNDLEYTFY